MLSSSACRFSSTAFANYTVAKKDKLKIINPILGWRHTGNGFKEFRKVFRCSKVKIFGYVSY